MVRSARRDGLKIQMVENLADLGSDSYHNAQRDLTDQMSKVGVLDHITQTKGNVFTWCISPTEVVKQICKSHTNFQKHLCPSRNACMQFWRDFLASESGVDYQRLHPHLRNKSIDDLATTIPCRVHEDAGPFTAVKSAVILSWSSLMGRGMDLETKYSGRIIVPC